MSVVTAEGPPFFSVIVAVRNGAATLERCLDSVFAQTFDDFELIVIDGGSTDGTVDVIARHAERIRYWVSEPDRGIYQAWNKALVHARGSWVIFLGADDRFHDAEVLEQVASPLAAAEGEYRVVYGEIIRVDGSGAIISRNGAPWPSLRAKFRKRMALPHQGVFHHRSLFERWGTFDERYRISGDYELLLRELVGHEALFVPVVVVDMEVGGISDRPDHRQTMVRESLRARRTHGLVTWWVWLETNLSWERARARAWIARTFGERTARRMGKLYRFVMRKSKPRRSEPSQAASGSAQ